LIGKEYRRHMICRSATSR